MTGIRILNDFVATHVLEGEAFTVTSNFQTISGSSEHDFLVLENPTASGVRLLVTHFKNGVDSTSARLLWRAYKNPTYTGGTAVDIENTNFDPAAPASVATVKMNPTVSDRGKEMNFNVTPSNASSFGVNRYYIMPENTRLLVSIENSISNISTFADIYWIEEPI